MNSEDVMLPHLLVVSVVAWVVELLGGLFDVDPVGFEDVVGSVVEMSVVLTVVGLDVVVGVVIFGVVVEFDETEVLVVGLRDVVLDDVVIVGVVCEVVLVVVSFPYKANVVNETMKSFLLLKGRIE